MPIYEYRCAECGHALDALQKISDEPLTRCPECDSESLKRLVSAPAFRLKGGGWYETDFKSDKEKKRNLVESSGETSKPEGKSEKKPGDEKKSGPASESASKSDAGVKTEKKDAGAKQTSNVKGSGSEAA